jgi:hypothetical protein
VPVGKYIFFAPELNAFCNAVVSFSKLVYLSAAIQQLFA